MKILKVDRATEADVLSVASALDHRSLREQMALSWASTPARLAEMLAEVKGGDPDVLCFSHYALGPVAIWTQAQIRPNVLSIGLFGTEAMPLLAIPMTRFARRELFPRFKAAGVHRIETVSIIGNVDAHRWLEIVGLAKEGDPIPGYGRDGQAFQPFAWVADHVARARQCVLKTDQAGKTRDSGDRIVADQRWSESPTM